MAKHRHDHDDEENSGQHERNRPDPWIKEQLCLLNKIVEQLVSLNQLGLKILDRCKPAPSVHLEFEVGPPTVKTKDPTMAVPAKSTTEEQLTVTLKPKTSTGKPAPLDGAPKWSVVDFTSAAAAGVVVSDDGLSALLISADTPGKTTILVTADADLTPDQPDGSGKQEISDTIEYEYGSPSAKNLGLEVGAPQPKPVPEA